MAVSFDKWLLLKVIEFLFVVGCLVCKKVTDDEESRLFLYLQKLSREWPYLNRVTWDRVGSAVADAVYGGYLIITAGMILGRALKELPSKKRAMERFFLGIGALLFIVLAGLEFAALDSVPPDLVDNAAVLGSLSLVTGILFLIDLAGPRIKLTSKHAQTSPHLQLRPLDIPPDLFGLENGNGRKRETINGHTRNGETNGHARNGSGKNGENGYSRNGENGFTRNGERASMNGKRKTETNNNERQKPKKFDIYGTDKDDSVAEIPHEMERHSPVFGKIHKPQYGQYDNVSPTYHRFQTDIEAPPSTPGDPGYVQYTAQRWGQKSQKTPRNSPTEV